MHQAGVVGYGNGSVTECIATGMATTGVASMCSHWTRPTSRRPSRRAVHDTNVKKPKPKIVRTGGQTFQQLSELKRKQTENAYTGAGLPQGDLIIPRITGRFTVSCIVQFIHTQRETTKQNYYYAGRYVLTPRPYKSSTKRGSQDNSTLLPEVSRPTSFKNY